MYLDPDMNEKMYQCNSVTVLLFADFKWSFFSCTFNYSMQNTSIIGPWRSPQASDAVQSLLMTSYVPLKCKFLGCRLHLSPVANKPINMFPWWLHPPCVSLSHVSQPPQNSLCLITVIGDSGIYFAHKNGQHHIGQVREGCHVIAVSTS